MSLTPFVCSVHTHTTLCDGKGTPENMARAAYEAGIQYFGFSGHSHTPVPADQGYVLPADLTEYRTRVLQLRETYAGRMEILLGIEWDSQSEGVPEEFDYWIGSVHHLRAPDGRYYSVDAYPEDLTAGRDALSDGDILTLTERYFADVANVAAKKPLILGHIDLITKLNRGNLFFDENASRYRNAALAALHAVDPDKTLLEINTGAMARGYRDTPYPAPFLLKEWRDMGGRVILTADAHSPEAVLYGYDQAAQTARDAGFDCCAVLTRNGIQECSL